MAFTTDLNQDNWLKFRRYILSENRYYLTEKWKKFVEMIIEQSETRHLSLSKGQLLFRARKDGKMVDQPEGGVELQPWGPQEILAPPPNSNTEGRLNPRGISYLYLAEEEKTAIAEIRPWIEEFVTVATVGIAKDAKLLDASKDNINPVTVAIARMSGKEIKMSFEEELWGNINNEFSKPVSSTDQLNYTPTQFLAEVFKNNGFDGIRYRSSLNPGGYNVTLFSGQDFVHVIKAQVFYVGKIEYEYEPLTTEYLF